ncbi:GNAT family N-acetyltransferase [Flavobacteriaceae bacterium]|nr:GNAT family N-acetyltransferase [Flavobacteriaceae bacterium]
MKRDYLEFFDFGFALLHNFYKKGYVTEASIAYLKYFFNNKSNLSIVAISKNKNKPSIKLLERLEFEFSKEIKYEKEIWKVFILKKEKFLS